MVAVAWTLKLDGVSAVVLGARDAEHVKDAALAASSLVLDDDDVADVAAAVHNTGPAGHIYGLERQVGTDLYDVAASGRLAKGGADRNSSKAASCSQLAECTERLGQIHRAYAASFPPPPEGLFSAPKAEKRQGDDDDDDNASDDASDDDKHAAPHWTADTPYSNLGSTELRDVLRGFVSEIDCLPQDHAPGGLRPLLGAPAPKVAQLRTFAARMLASSEQAVFVQMRKKRGVVRRAPVRANYDDTTRDAANAAQHAFRARVMAACLNGDAPPTASGQDAAPPNCLLS